MPRRFVVAVEHGVLGALQRGRDGWPVVDVEVTLLDGETHVKDSSPMAFEVAGSLAVQQALNDAGTLVLEPTMRLKLSAPEDFVGSVLSEVAGRRGAVVDVQTRGAKAHVVAHVALGRLFGFVDALRSRTEGRGEVSMQLHGYQVQG